MKNRHGWKKPAAWIAASVGLVAAAAPALSQQAIGRQALGSGNFSQPVGLAAIPGDTSRVFIVEQGGTIRIVDLATNTTLATPFLNIGPTGLNLTVANGEQGLLGLAFDPGYATNGRFYLNYTNRTTGATVIQRFTANAPFATSNTANTASGLTLLTFSQPFANHNGGQLAFGPDGKLYVGSGDGGSGGDPNELAQNLASPLGKILRLDVNNQAGAFVATDNPYAAAGNPGNDYIWHYGARNPWRLSFDRSTGDLYIADVGQDTREEVTFQPALTAGNLNAVRGLNLGWDCREGQIGLNVADLGCDPAAAGYTNAIFDLAHANGVCSITGGYVYRGAAMPSLNGTYFYSDFCGNFVRSVRYTGTTNLADHRDWTAALGGVSGIVSFGEDAAGELYVVSINGPVFKIVPVVDSAQCGCPCLTTGLDTLFSDNFNTATGWTSSSAATDGAWERAAPIFSPDWTNDPIGDSDGSGSCFVTRNANANSDVDGGSVTLVSPAFDWAGREITLCYDYFLYLSLVTAPNDSLVVQVSSNGTNGPWVTVANHITHGVNHWRNNVINQAALTAAGVTNTANMRVRFVASDVGTASVVEAGVDAFKVFATPIVTPCPADFDGSGTVDPDDLADFISCYFNPPCAGADFDGSGIVNPDDLADFIAAYFTPCP
jgi:hypothetical protein